MPKSRSSPRTMKSTRTSPITPGSTIAMNLRQMIIVIVAVASAVFGYAYLVYTLNSHSTAIVDIDKKIDSNATTAVKSAEEQDAKREDLGKQFLENSKETSQGIATLNTTVGIQGEALKNAADSLNKISTQLNTLNLSLAAGHK